MIRSDINQEAEGGRWTPPSIDNGAPLLPPGRHPPRRPGRLLGLFRRERTRRRSWLMLPGTLEATWLGHRSIFPTKAAIFPISHVINEPDQTGV